MLGRRDGPLYPVILALQSGVGAVSLILAAREHNENILLRQWLNQPIVEIPVPNISQWRATFVCLLVCFLIVCQVF